MRYECRMLGAFFLPVVVWAQIGINSFDGAVQEKTINWTLFERAPSRIRIWDDSTDVHEGQGALRASVVIGAINAWGSFAQIGYEVPPGESPMNWMESDSLFVWLKVHRPPSLPENFVFRMHLVDQPTPGDNKEEYIYENTEILDRAQGWVRLAIPLVERESDGSVLPNDEGFVLFPKTWGGGSYNNEVLDFDHLVRYSFVLVTSGWSSSGPLPADSIEVSFDAFARSGKSPVKEKAHPQENFHLLSNYPNPFNSSTEIVFSLLAPDRIHFTIFNPLGKEIMSFTDHKNAGVYRIHFEAGNLPSGVYCVCLQTSKEIRVRKMVLLR